MNKSALSRAAWSSAVLVLIIVNKVLCDPEELLPIRFAGQLWDYKVGDRRGPGPNIYKQENIYVDSEDRLHLHIRKDQNEHGGHNWSCAEVISRKTGFGYGLYSWTIESDLSSLDPSVVLGLYTWDSTDTTHSDYNREIDIEFSKWNNPKDKTNAQFVVQPYYYRTNIVRFAQPNTSVSIHEFLWTEDNIKFRSYDLNGNILNWNFNRPDQNKTVFTPSDGVSVRMNLWLWRKIPPASNKNHHIIISDFNYTPVEDQLGIYFD